MERGCLRDKYEKEDWVGTLKDEKIQLEIQLGAIRVLKEELKKSTSKYSPIIPADMGTL